MQELYNLPLKRNGNWQHAPKAFPPKVSTPLSHSSVKKKQPRWQQKSAGLCEWHDIDCVTGNQNRPIVWQVTKTDRLCGVTSSAWQAWIARRCQHQPIIEWCDIDCVTGNQNRPIVWCDIECVAGVNSATLPTSTDYWVVWHRNM